MKIFYVSRIATGEFLFRAFVTTGGGVSAPQVVTISPEAYEAVYRSVKWAASETLCPQSIDLDCGLRVSVKDPRAEYLDRVGSSAAISLPQFSCKGRS